MIDIHDPSEAGDSPRSAVSVPPRPTAEEERRRIDSIPDGEKRMAACRRRRAEIDRLGDEIAVLSAQINAATYELLVRIREFDRREGWADHGARSCAHWLAWRTSLARGAAREKVRVARALEALPVLSEAMRRGEVSYSKECRPYCTSLRQWSARKPLALLGPGWIGSWRFVEVAAAGVSSAGVRRE